MTDNPSKIIKHAITRYLSMREHSQHELLQKLAVKGFVGNEVANMIQQFSAADIQSDYRFAECMVRNCVNKGQGLARIKNALTEHNLAYDIFPRVLSELDIDWFELAKQVADKKYKELAKIEWSERQKRMRFMQYRGFSKEQIEYALADK